VQHTSRLQQLQMLAFQHFPGALRELALLHLSAIDARASLETHLGRLPDAELHDLLGRLHLRSADTPQLPTGRRRCL
jgi:hypothetical protein